MLGFLNEDYAKVFAPHSVLSDSVVLTTDQQQSEQELTLAFYNCHVDAHRNQAYASPDFRLQPIH